MPRGKELLVKYSGLFWYAALALLTATAIGIGVSIYLSGGAETEMALEKGRRLIIDLETGEISGTRLALDGSEIKPVMPEPAPVATTNTPPDETPVDPSIPETSGDPVEIPVSNTPRTPIADLDAALTEQTEEGILPAIGSDGTKPWRHYAKPFQRQSSRPMVAIIVSGLGEGRDVTQAALNLPENITLSISPYARDRDSWANAIRAMGHELLIDLPLQPTDYPATDPGPFGLLLEKGPTESERNLRLTLSRFPATVGVLTPQNESFTDNDEAFRLILQSLANRGLLLVMGREPHRQETRGILDASHTAALVANVFVDEELNETAIQTRLSLLEEQARKSGYAIGIAQAYPITIRELALWAAALEERGIVLVPVTAIARLRFS